MSSDQHSSDPEQSPGVIPGAFPIPIFVGGLQRSGTTLLARLIAGHADVTGLVHTPTSEDEGQFVQDVFLDDHQMGSTKGRIAGRPMRWAFHEEAHLVASDTTGRGRAAERLRSSWGPYLESRDSRFFVEKSPSNLMRTLFLQELFPDAKFIVITRHPVIQALAVRKWGTRAMRAGLHLDRIIEHWLTAMECFRADASLLANVIVVSYEDLVAKPALTMARIQRFIGLNEGFVALDEIADHSSAYLDYWRSMKDGRFRTMAASPGRPAGVKAVVLRLIERGITGLFGRRIVSSIERRFGERIGRFGYELGDVCVSRTWSW